MMDVRQILPRFKAVADAGPNAQATCSADNVERRVEPRTATTVQVMDVRRISVATTATVVVVAVYALL